VAQSTALTEARNPASAALRKAFLELHNHG
jgi:hypothetical protein